MSPRALVIDTEDRRARLLALLKVLPLDKPWEVFIQDYIPKRSGNQNRRYWMLLGLLSKGCGHDKDELHEIFKSQFLGTVEVEFAGQKRVLPKSSKKLKKDEFNLYMTQVESFIIENFNIFLGS